MSVIKKIEKEVGKVIIGQKHMVSLVSVSLLANGHILLMGLPGLAKTLLIKAVARVFSVSFNRIQFTPDLMPADLIGYDILEEKKSGKEMKFIKGPVFCNLLLADEINRTPPKTQAALLQSMQEREVSVLGRHYQLKPPFMVMATQNPLEQEGTYPLPEAQLDRFLFLLKVDYPTYDEEVKISSTDSEAKLSNIKALFKAGDIMRMQKAAARVKVAARVNRWVVKLVNASRPGSEYALKDVKKYVEYGASPRGSKFLLNAAKAAAYLKGKNQVERDDIEDVIHPVLRHRIFLNFSGQAEAVEADQIIDKLLKIKI
ncbi:MAG TPA: MoxR family ATPase [Spirochaetota bacterium]|nr:MoxR family ATPase [Spirochaetota bacterium]